MAVASMSVVAAAIAVVAALSATMPAQAATTVRGLGKAQSRYFGPGDQIVSFARK